ncbi:MULTISPECIES: CCA tRNA nucleotidyltransferase [unclassified Sporosarcina]|uniref:CCA tRNA nucleotidyltransferase n=1 Tax=unclassified Sporosarcina TaxID=2647733 RepID=UPI000C16CFF1|nr:MULTISPECIES: CCA tRNA nucleotidyltransferase [unclassified Sporosarcina]PID05233.1 CCA tRNA nucleotidyltransferase [Sporosarcina sp. P30]PID08507.1 CCA tRNA nucleotidyltransferase [Sporosarcina sp. P31]PID11500.1 CCA tRNA nucleotidyltransferase [Sporosarcina sp. P32b]
MTASFGSAASRQVLRELHAAGYEAVFVGGAVRDAELGKKPLDIDITTSATPHQVKEVFRHTIDIGIEHGTILVLMHGEPIEVTTYRTDTTYNELSHTVYVTSLQEDLQHRDFTVNALAMTVDGELIDLFDGLKDLRQKVIRSVGRPEERIQEDPLRIFRALRFSSVLDFEIEWQTLYSMGQLASSLRHVAIERIKTEMDKLFQGLNPSRAFHYGREIGLPKLFSELFTAFESLDRYTPFLHARHGFAAMLTVTDTSATELARLYKLSNEEKRFLKLYEEAYAVRTERPFDLWDFYSYPTDVLEVVGRIYYTNHEGHDLSSQQIEQHKKQLPILQRADLAFTGKDLLIWSGKSGGRWTSEWIMKIERAVVYGQIENDALAIKEWFINETSREK